MRSVFYRKELHPLCLIICLSKFAMLRLPISILEMFPFLYRPIAGESGVAGRGCYNFTFLQQIAQFTLCRHPHPLLPPSRYRL